MEIVIDESVDQVIELTEIETIVEVADFDLGLRQMLEAEQADTVICTGTLTLDDSYNVILLIDPGGAARTVVLPPEDSANHGFLVFNTGEGSEILTFQNDASDEIAKVYPDGAGWFVSNGSVWKSAGLGTSNIANQRVIYWRILPAESAASVSDGLDYFTVPEEFNGWNIVKVEVALDTASTSGGTEWQLYNVTDSVDVLSTPVTTDEDELSSYTAAAPAVVDTTKDDLATGDRLRADCDDPGTDTAGVTYIITLEAP